MSTITDLYANAPSAVPYADNGLQLSYDIINYKGDSTIRYILAGADLAGFIGTVAGLPQDITYYNGVTATRIVPLQHPMFGALYAANYSIQPADNAVALDPSNGVGAPQVTFDWYIADVHFATPPYNYVGPSALVKLQTTGGCDFVTQPGSAYVFPSDGIQPEKDVGVPVRTVEFVLEFQQMPKFDLTKYAPLAGCVNSVPFWIPTGVNSSLTFDPGTIQYGGPQSSGQWTIPIISGGAQPVYNISHMFRYRQVQHNMIMRPDGSGFEAPVRRRDNTKFLLESADLNVLYA